MKSILAVTVVVSLSLSLSAIAQEGRSPTVDKAGKYMDHSTRINYSEDRYDFFSRIEKVKQISAPQQKTIDSLIARYPGEADGIRSLSVIRYNHWFINETGKDVILSVFDMNFNEYIFSTLVNGFQFTVPARSARHVSFLMLSDPKETSAWIGIGEKDGKRYRFGSATGSDFYYPDFPANPELLFESSNKVVPIANLPADIAKEISVPLEAPAQAPAQ